MDLNALSDALAQVFLDWKVLATIVGAAAYGIFMGAVPGLTATMAVALMIPLTYAAPPVFAFAGVVTLVACAIFAGDIPTVLLRMPGTPSSAAYADDAYALACAGRARETLRAALAYSVVGGLFGATLLIFLARPLAQIAVEFTYFEYFWLYVLGLSCAAIVARGSPAKGALALGIGLLLSTVGLGTVYSTARFTFDSDDLKAGIEFIPAMIGLIGVSEILRNLVLPPDELEAVTAASASSPRGRRAESTESAELAPSPAGDAAGARPPETLRSRIFRRKAHTLRSSSIGSVIGMLPGAGADIAAWVALAASKRFSRTPREYGRGSLDGVSDATAANNAAVAGAWVPALVLGIPGDSITALVISVLYMKKIVPGPDIFATPEKRTLVYSIYVLFIVANLVLIPIGLLAIRAGTRLVCLPRRVLLPCILLFTIVGAYAYTGSASDVWLMLALGVVGFALERHRVPLGPVVLGLVLGNPLEEKLIQGLVASGGSPFGFFSRPLAAVLGITTIAMWVAPLVARLRRPRRNARA